MTDDNPLNGMTPEQILTAARAGDLEELIDPGAAERRVEEARSKAEAQERHRAISPDRDARRLAARGHALNMASPEIRNMLNRDN